MSTIIRGMLVEIRHAFIVLTDPRYIMLPPGMKVKHFVGERLTVTVTWDGGLWNAERIERDTEGQ